MTNEELIIAKRIAEIEGIAVEYPMFNEVPFYRYSTDGIHNLKEYNPFNWSVLGPLMLKCEVSIDYEECDVWIQGVLICDPFDSSLPTAPIVSFKHVSDIPKAILECIIKSKGGE